MESGQKESPTVLIDTNILIYAYDPGAGEKHEIALRTVQEIAAQGKMVLSAQVINEFYWVSTRPGRGPGLKHEEASGILDDICASGVVFPLTQTATFRALKAMENNSMAFWDALVWAVAAENGVSTICTEDFQNGCVVDGVRFYNPFVGDWIA